MLRWTKWIAPMASLVLVLALGIANSRAADSATPKGKAKVTVTVVDADGKPVAAAKVAIIAAPAKKAKGAATSQPDGAAKPLRPDPLQSGVSGADGTFVLTDMADGDFFVTARLKGTGNGREKVTITDGKDQTITVTLKAAKPKTN